MSVTVSWDITADQPPARIAAWKSMTAAAAHDKDAWLALYADDAVLQDPVGPSMFDPDGKGHHGRTAIAAFWDNAIANVERFEFVMRDSHAVADEVANTGTITSYLPGGYRVDTDLITVYKVDDTGKIVSMRAFWEVARAMATARQVED